MKDQIVKFEEELRSYVSILNNRDHRILLSGSGTYQYPNGEFVDQYTVLQQMEAMRKQLNECQRLLYILKDKI